MKKFLILSAVLSVSAIAAPATCTLSTLSSLIDSPCALGDKIFDNFAYSGNVTASNISVNFEMVGNEFHVILSPITGSGFFTDFSLTDRVSVVPGVAPDIFPANYQIVGVKDQSDFSAMAGSSGLLIIANTPGPTFNLAPGSETASQFFSGTPTVTTVSTLTGPAGTGDSNPGLESLELDYIQANTAVPEPATLGLIGIALVGGGLLRKRVSAAR